VDLTLTDALGRRSDFLVVDLDRFQGPLDLLLHLIRTQDIDVFDIPIATITSQFLRAIEGIEATELDGAGEFLEMAAALIRIKAQMLLPRVGDQEHEDPRAELVRRLLEYEQVRQIAQRLSAAEAERARRFSKGYVPPRPRPRQQDTPLTTTWEEVFAAALEVEMPEPRDRHHMVTPRSVAMSDKIVLILDRLRHSDRVAFSRLLEDFQDRMHAVMTFLARLELTRRHILMLRQSRPFTELWLYRRPDEEAGDGAEPSPPSVAEPDPRPASGTGPGDPPPSSQTRPSEGSSTP